MSSSSYRHLLFFGRPSYWPQLVRFDFQWLASERDAAFSVKKNKKDAWLLFDGGFAKSKRAFDVPNGRTKKRALSSAFPIDRP